MKAFHRVALLTGAMVSFHATAYAQVAADTRAAVPGATATEPASGGLADIVVTARRRTERLQNVPVAVAAIAPAQLSNGLATDLAKVAELAPQVMIGRQTNGTGAILTIRGISTTATDAALDQSVAVSIDNVVLSRGRIITAAVFDLAQVEILEGPQALFFGKNSPAGVISLRSEDPTKSLKGYLRGGYEFEAKERYAEGAISGPLTNNLGARIAFRAARMDGWIKNIATPVADPLHPGVIAPGALNGDTGPKGNDIAARATLAWAPSDDFDANLKVTYGHQRLNAMNGYTESFCINPNDTPKLLGSIPLPQADCRKDMRKAESALPARYAANYPLDGDGIPYVNSDAVLTALTLNKKLGDLNLTSTTGYYWQYYRGANNADYTEYALIWDSQSERYRLLTQELRLASAFDGPLNFTIGAYYEHSRRKWANYPDLFHGGINPTVNNYTTVETFALAHSESLSGFGQARWKIAETLELAAGARYTHDRKDQDAVNTANGVTTLKLYPQGQILHADYRGNNVSPEVTLSWHPGRDHLIYAAYKTGYKSGGLSNSALLLATATPANIRFSREKTHGFEAGYKGDLLDHHLRVDLTGYRYKYEDLQLGTFDPATISFLIGNAAAARTTGVEGSLTWLVQRDLTLRGNLGYNIAKFLDYRNSQCYPGQTAALGCVSGVQDLSGKRLPRAPRLTFNLGANYDARLGGGWKSSLSVDGTYTSSYQAAADNSPGGIQDAFWRLNAAVHLTPPGERFRLSVIGRNLTNSYYLVTAVGRPAAATTEFIGTFNRPREIALQGEVRF